MTHIARVALPVALILSFGLAGCSAAVPHQEPAPAKTTEAPAVAESEKTEEPVAAAGTRENPIPADTVTEYDPASMWRFSVGATNPDATADVMAQNEYNTLADGSVFVTAPFYVQVKSEADPEGADPSGSLLIEYVSAKGNSFATDGACTINDPLYVIGTMYPGAEGRATLCAAVPRDATIGGTWKVTSYAKPDAFIFLDGAN